MDKDALGKNIAFFRKEKHMTQKNLADLVFVTDKAVSKWERGLSFPDLSMIDRLADALEVSTAKLLGLEEASPEESIKELTRISEEEKSSIRRSLKFRAWCGIVICVLLLVSAIAASWLFYRLGHTGGIYGAVTTGMLGFIGLTAGNWLFLLRKVNKL